MSFQRRIEQICRKALDARGLRVELLRELQVAVPHDFYAWLLTDPESCVGCDPVAEIPKLGDLPAVIRLKYLTPTNRWTTLATNSAATLMTVTQDDRSESRVWNELLNDYGIDDIVSVVLRDRYGCWGFLDLWRVDGAFSNEECALLQQFTDLVTPPLRQSLLPTFHRRSNAPEVPLAPAILLMSGEGELLTQTPQTDAYLRALLPPEPGRSPVPAAAYNVAAQLLAREAGVDDHPPWARVHVGDGMWVTLSAARIAPTSTREGAAIAVSIEQTQPLQRAALYARVVGLTDRETEVFRLVVGGTDTRSIADRLYVSGHTVQDHLKQIFAKTGVNSRRTLIARATGVA